MDPEKKKRFEEAGWTFGDAADFVGLSQEEQAYIDIQLALGRLIRSVREEKGLSQPELAARVGSSQSRVSKMERGNPTVSIDLQIRTLLALEVSPRDIAEVFPEEADDERESALASPTGV